MKKLCSLTIICIVFSTFLSGQTHYGDFSSWEAKYIEQKVDTLQKINDSIFCLEDEGIVMYNPKSDSMHLIPLKYTHEVNYQLDCHEMADLMKFGELNKKIGESTYYDPVMFWKKVSFDVNVKCTKNNDGTVDSTMYFSNHQEVSKRWYGWIGAIVYILLVGFITLFIAKRSAIALKPITLVIAILLLAVMAIMYIFVFLPVYSSSIEGAVILYMMYNGIIVSLITLIIVGLLLFFLAKYWCR